MEQRRKAGIAQLARASAFQAEGRGFESRFPLHNLDILQYLRIVIRFIGTLILCKQDRTTCFKGAKIALLRFT